LSDISDSREEVEKDENPLNEKSLKRSKNYRRRTVELESGNYTSISRRNAPKILP
jgi:hypothetical protein